MKRIFYIQINLCLLLIIFFSASLKAQVVIGGDGQKIASNYSILQLEYDQAKYPAGAGLQLSRINDLIERNALQAKITSSLNPEEAIGLTIYYVPKSEIEFWNGIEWVPIPGSLNPTFNATNGLTKTKDTYDFRTMVGLGGNLTESTAINQQGHSINFNQSGVYTPLFKIKSATSDLFTVIDKKVGLGTSTTPEAKLHIVGQTPNDDANKRGFRYNDGSSNKANKVLMKDNITGNAYWGDATTTPYVSVLPAPTIKQADVPSIAVNQYVNVKTYNNLSKGRWLLIGKCNMQLASYNNNNYATGALYCWAKITDGSNNVLSVAGLKTESSGYKWSTPEIVVYKEFATDNNTVTLSVMMPSIGASKDVDASTLGMDENKANWASFFAIKLAD